MDRNTLHELPAFLAVARERSFTRAAAQLGLSPSALSHTIRALEARLGLRLLTRTTRNVAPTAAGERLLARVGPLFEDVDRELDGLAELRTRPAGRLRITAVEHPADTLLWPAIRRLLDAHDDIGIEISADYGLADLVAGRFDAGIRLGEQVAPGMIARRLGPDMRLAVVAAPSYLARQPAPETPRDLLGHRCIGLRLPTHGALLPWWFRNGERELTVRVEPRLVFNTLAPLVTAAIEGYGLAYTLDAIVQEHLDAGRLVRVLDDWCAPVQGYHLYYPSRRHHPPAFVALLQALGLGTAAAASERPE